MGFEDSSLTPSACGMLQILSARLMQLKELLAENLFNKAWHSLATQFSQVSRLIIKNLSFQCPNFQFLMEELVMENWFSLGGGRQLQYDLIHGLFPLFGQFTPRPDNLFKPYDTYISQK